MYSDDDDDDNDADPYHGLSDDDNEEDHNHSHSSAGNSSRQHMLKYGGSIQGGMSSPTPQMMGSKLAEP